MIETRVKASLTEALARLAGFFTHNSNGESKGLGLTPCCDAPTLAVSH